MQRDAPRIFISHRSTDLEIVQRVVQLLTEAMDVRKGDIRCTSVPGCKLPIGSSASKMLAQEVAESAVFVCLITKEATQSPYVLFEMGARWGSGKDVLPLLGPGAHPSLLPAPIADRHAAQTAIRTDMLQFVHEVARELGLPPHSGDTYDRTLDEIVKYSGLPASRGKPVEPQVPAPAAAKNEGRKRKSQVSHGFCIRCRGEIPLDRLKPYCRADFEEWAQWENEHYVDKYCHGCGKPTRATMVKPLCESCYQALS